MISRKEVSQAEIAPCDLIVSFALNPRFYTEKYSEDLNFDLQFIPIIKKLEKKYIYLSSRKVYPRYEGVAWKENDPLVPSTHYGMNKKITEEILQKELEENVLILRMSNVFGFEVRKGRETLWAFLLNAILETEFLPVNTNYKTIKDFLPVSAFCQIITFFIKDWHPGIYNVGSGIGFPLGEALDAFSSTYTGNIDFSFQQGIYDPYLLDVSKLKQISNFELTKADLIEEFKALGTKLSKYESLFHSSKTRIS